MLCDACNVRPEWKGEHRCHAPSGDGPRDMMVGGIRFFGNCDCDQCKIPTKAEIQKILKKARGG